MNLSKRAIAEFLGTFWPVFGGCGSAVLAAAFPQLGIGNCDTHGKCRPSWRPKYHSFNSLLTHLGPGTTGSTVWTVSPLKPILPFTDS
jgi:hypothetical protein